MLSRATHFPKITSFFVRQLSRNATLYKQTEAAPEQTLNQDNIENGSSTKNSPTSSNSSSTAATNNNPNQISNTHSASGNSNQEKKNNNFRDNKQHKPQKYQNKTSNYNQYNNYNNNNNNNNNQGHRNSNSNRQNQQQNYSNQQTNKTAQNNFNNRLDNTKPYQQKFTEKKLDFKSDLKNALDNLKVVDSYASTKNDNTEFQPITKSKLNQETKFNVKHEKNTFLTKNLKLTNVHFFIILLKSVKLISYKNILQQLNPYGPINGVLKSCHVN
jgi:hypothetical protein